jgi:MFS family permease
MAVETKEIRRSWLVQRSPFFYGWVVWLVAVLANIASMPGQTFSISLFIDHYIVDLGMDRTAVSGLYGLGTFIAALSLTWIGRQIDLRGNRRVSVVICILFALALMASSTVAGPIGLFLSFMAIRGLGQGSMGLISTTAVVQWFQKRRGQVLGFSLVIYALLQSVYLPWMQGVVDAIGWRQSWVVLGLGIALLVLPLMWIFLRDRPEDFGLVPDGVRGQAAQQGSDVSWSLREALRTPLIWAFLSARMLSTSVGSSLILHQVSLFTGQGHGPDVAAAVYGNVALMTAVFTLVGGQIIDRIAPRAMIALQLACMVTTLLLALHMQSPLALIGYAVAFGAFLGLCATFDGTVWVAIYGRAHQGAIRGFVATVVVAGTSFGPVLYGLSYDHLGSYEPAIWLGIGLALLVTTASLLVRTPRKA